MIELTEWGRQYPVLDRPWLVIGKGPSFSRVHEVDLDRYNLVSLNHVVRELKVHVAHIIDLEVVNDCADSLLENADWVLMPYWPHIKFKVMQSLPELLRSVPVLGELERRNKLVWYNFATGSPHGDSPIIPSGYFGSEAVVNILATLGVKVIRTLGIDGGGCYHPAFRDLADKTLLANGWSSFDMQFVGIHRTAAEHNIDFGPLNTPIRIFVGTDETQTVAARVLEYTIRKHTSRPVEFTHLDTVEVPLPRDPINQPRTAFSFKRFAIPALCGYRGRALYLDADMLVFDDIAKLWDFPMGPHEVLCTWQPETPEVWRDKPHLRFKPGRQMSVMLLDCARLQWDAAAIVRGLDEGRYSYEQLMFDLCVVPPEKISEMLPPEWNHLERYDPAATKLLHYTAVDTQPWKSDNNPLGHIWMRQYAEAVAAGAVPAEEVKQGVAKGFLKPALAACLSPALPPASPATPARPDQIAPQRLELQARAALAEAETLIAQAQATELAKEVQALKQRIDEIYRSWNWTIGRLALAPARLPLAALRRIARLRAARRGKTPAFDKLPALYGEMHAKGLFPGVTWRNVFDSFVAVIPGLDHRTILDFGCGPRGGLAERFGDRVISYDPYVEAYSQPPWDRHFDVVFSSDVLEHLPLQQIKTFAADVLRCHPEFVFLNISTREAHKTFSDGANVHVTVKPTGWWRDTLNGYWGKEYDYRLVHERSDECTLLFSRRGERVDPRSAGLALTAHTQKVVSD